MLVYLILFVLCSLIFLIIKLINNNKKSLFLALDSVIDSFFVLSVIFPQISSKWISLNINKYFVITVFCILCIKFVVQRYVQRKQYSQRYSKLQSHLRFNSSCVRCVQDFCQVFAYFCEYLTITIILIIIELLIFVFLFRNYKFPDSNKFTSNMINLIISKGAENIVTKLFLLLTLVYLVYFIIHTTIVIFKYSDFDENLLRNNLFDFLTKIILSLIEMYSIVMGFIDDEEAKPLYKIIILIVIPALTFSAVTILTWSHEIHLHNDKNLKDNS